MPGALVSVVCSNALNRAVKEFGITEPGKILDKVRELVLETFSQRDTLGEKGLGDVQDGMDISLAALTLPSVIVRDEAISSREKRLPRLDDGSRSDDNIVRVTWAGANNPLWIVKKSETGSESGWVELPPDKQPIGKFDRVKPFTTHTVNLRKGDCIYLFTDGYADQFGGAKGKKFKYKQLQEVLLANSDKPMAEQGKILEKTFEKWMGFLDQIDDVLVIGIRVNRTTILNVDKVLSKYYNE